MNKYIDAEKLKVEIERRMKCYDRDGCEPNDGKWVELVTIKHFIDSLQREQPEVDLDKEIDKEWAKCEPIDEGMGLESATIVNEQFNSIARRFIQIGLNARKEELPEIELNKFTERVKTFQGRYKYPEILSIKGAMAFMARMFYQYPSVARQWYDRLPKSIID